MVSLPPDDHPVFSELSRYAEFYEFLGDAVLQWLTPGTHAVCNVDSYVFSSIGGTLSSIQTILRSGRINDAYALLRKYFDSAVINIYANLYCEENSTFESFIVEQIDNWLKGTACLPKYREMVQYIRSSNIVSPITRLLFADAHYKRLRDRCNDHTHYNSFSHVV